MARGLLPSLGFAALSLGPGGGLRVPKIISSCVSLKCNLPFNMKVFKFKFASEVLVSSHHPSRAY